MIPLIINSAERMLKIRVMTVRDHSEQALKILQKTGVLHVEESKDLKPTDKAAIEQQRREVNELLNFANRLLSYVSQKETVSLGEDVEVIADDLTAKETIPRWSKQHGHDIISIEEISIKDNGDHFRIVIRKCGNRK